MSKTSSHAAAFNALGDPTRRSIFEKLANGPLSVVHIADGLPISRPAVSQHLKVLREAKLITMEQSGTRSMYRIDRDGVRSLRDYLDKFWDQALLNFKELAEQAEKQKKK
ncbi:MAG TPA: metalloregulator ArsR/SmtB family transcription factor [Dinghuibacter sp.]|uniref:ArsR/SmtB family transcription factor n=1 Tax=Dinghuibacter sp. TaxID=2024697 RepID=UPI002D0EA262|nr:metalloregulator ArsR/SmtB family transcription factor [Dinghuibacter sp.]HTJ13266.1 metalloregulator ArsR/SmtB family transcription factor [Dinghuibacter sp.]